MNANILALHLAAEHANVGDPFRSYFLGAMGIRRDGATVLARNGAAQHKMPGAHAEARIARKLDFDSTVYVARVNKSGEWAMARPCNTCLAKLRAKGVRKIVYTIRPGEYGIIW